MTTKAKGITQPITAPTYFKGSFTLIVSITQTILDSNITGVSKILLTPLNAAAATLMSGTKSLYISAKTPGTGFTLATADGTLPVGTELFDYVIFN